MYIMPDSIFYLYIMPDGIFYDSMGWRMTEFSFFFLRGGNRCIHHHGVDTCLMLLYDII